MRYTGSVLAAGLLLLSSPTLSQTTNDPSLLVETVVSGLDLPTAMAFIGNDDILVLEQHTGRVRRVISGVLQPGDVLDLPVAGAFDNGLLGIALSPEFISNHHVFLFYSAATVDGDPISANRVVRYTWDGSQLINPSPVLDIPASTENLVGGIVNFGPDDKLYTLVGCMERSGKLQNFPAGADPDDSGVILRTNADGSGVPGNPFFAASGSLAAMRRYYAYGIRNSFGFTFDPETGVLWDTENGAAYYDEINRITPGSNSGWEQLSGPLSRNTQTEADLWAASGSHYQEPVFSWNLPVGLTSIAFVRNPKLGCGRMHDVLVGNSNCGSIQYFVVNAARDGLTFSSPELADFVADNSAFMQRCSQEQAELAFGSGFGVTTDIETGPDGNLYVVDLIGGEIRRIKPALAANVDTDADGVANVCDCNTADSGSWSPTAETPRLRLAGAGATTLSWDAQRGVVGPSVTYTVVTQSLTALRATGSFAAACTLDTGLTEPLLADSRATPSPGEGYVYLARASNGCGAGSFGDASPVPDPRDAIDAALPPACGVR